VTSFIHTATPRSLTCWRRSDSRPSHWPTITCSVWGKSSSFTQWYWGHWPADQDQTQDQVTGQPLPAQYEASHLHSHSDTEITDLLTKIRLKTKSLANHYLLSMRQVMFSHTVTPRSLTCWPRSDSRPSHWPTITCSVWGKSSSFTQWHRGHWPADQDQTQDQVTGQPLPAQYEASHLHSHSDTEVTNLLTKIRLKTKSLANHYLLSMRQVIFIHTATTRSLTCWPRSDSRPSHWPTITCSVWGKSLSSWSAHVTSALTDRQFQNHVDCCSYYSAVVTTVWDVSKVCLHVVWRCHSGWSFLFFLCSLCYLFFVSFLLSIHEFIRDRQRCGGTAAVALLLFRLGDPALCGSHHLVSPY